MKIGDKNFTADSVLDIFVKILVEEEQIRDLFQKISYMEVNLRVRHRSYKELSKLIIELPVSMAGRFKI